MLTRVSQDINLGPGGHVILVGYRVMVIGVGNGGIDLTPLFLDRIYPSPDGQRHEIDLYLRCYRAKCIDECMLLHLVQVRELFFWYLIITKCYPELFLICLNPGGLSRRGLRADNPVLQCAMIADLGNVVDLRDVRNQNALEENRDNIGFRIRVHSGTLYVHPYYSPPIQITGRASCLYLHRYLLIIKEFASLEVNTWDSITGIFDRQHYQYIILMDAYANQFNHMLIETPRGS
jgi:hypothetical protein